MRVGLLRSGTQQLAGGMPNAYLVLELNGFTVPYSSLYIPGKHREVQSYKKSYREELGHKKMYMSIKKS